MLQTCYVALVNQRARQKASVWLCDCFQRIQNVTANMASMVRSGLPAHPERPRQPFSLLCASNDDLARFVVTQGKRKGRSLCLIGVHVLGTQTFIFATADRGAAVVVAPVSVCTPSFAQSSFTYDTTSNKRVKYMHATVSLVVETGIGVFSFHQTAETMLVKGGHRWIWRGGAPTSHTCGLFY